MRAYDGRVPVNVEQGRSARSGAATAILVAGGCSVLLGAVTLLWPDRTVLLVAWLLGTSLLASALLQVALAVQARLNGLLRALVGLSAALTFTVAILCYRSDNFELLSLWLGIGWAVRGTVQALVGAWDDDLPNGLLHEVCGMCTVVAGVVIIAIRFETLTGVAVFAGAGLIVLGVMELTAGGLIPLPTGGRAASRPAP